MAGVEGRVAVVTGAGSEMADNVVTEITGAGGEAAASYDDVSTEDGGAAVVQTALDAFGQIDIVINNAGILRDVTFHKMAHDQWDAVLQVHLYGTWNVTKAAWPHLREQSYGRVVMTTSTSGIYGNFGQSNYGAAKLGIVGLANVLALEGRKYNINVNAVAPVAATRMTEDIMPPEVLERLDPAYVSPAVVQLCAEECTDTGVVILAGGGQYARIAFFQAPGVMFDKVPSVDDVAARWSEITDMRSATLGQPLAAS
jgi:NAD(P)-dependent dehydrogenase (short-subunit alcohol dehydrogenase family)